MTKLRLTSKHSLLSLGLLLLALFVVASYSVGQITVQFLYWDPTTDPQYCGSCPAWAALYQEFLTKNATVTALQNNYTQVDFQWIDFNSQAGVDLRNSLNITSPNSLMINGTIKIQGDFNETYIREAIDDLLNETLPPTQSPTPLLPLLASAFLIGSLQTFSPCLIALMSFVVGYTVGDAAKPKNSFSRVMTFGIGFLIATMVVGFVLSIILLSLPTLQTALTWTVCIFALLFGLSLTGLLKTPFTSKSLMAKLTGIRPSTSGGLFLLGFLFYFIAPCVAPIFFATLSVLFQGFLAIVLVAFSLGVIVPFLVLATLTSSISKFAQVTGKNKRKIRFVSGLILIGYALYIILFHLLL